MAEIKSTLELVMERTRHLHMTDEDKRKQAALAFKETVNRLTLKYLDRQVDLEQFRTELNRLGGESTSDMADAAAEIGRRIDPAADNAPLLDLIKYGLDFDVSGIEAALHYFREALHRQEDQACERLKADLLKKGILGSAVVPNLEADKDWAKRREEMLDTVREELAAQIAQLKRRR
jgi:hypothetical protein